MKPKGIFGLFAAAMAIGGEVPQFIEPARGIGKRYTRTGTLKPRGNAKPAGTGRKVYRYARAQFK